jgi:hypothetical protein
MIDCVDLAGRPDGAHSQARGHQRHRGVRPARRRPRRGAAVASLETQDAEFAPRIGVATHLVADLDARVSQIDAAFAEASRQGRTTGAMCIMEAQCRTRAGPVDERNREAGSGRSAETEVAPIRYVAELVSGLAIRLLIRSRSR